MARSNRRPSEADPRQGVLIELPRRNTEGKDEVRFARLESQIWTENKARLIARYLYYFAYITRCGTYVDGFAGPQRIKKPDSWKESWAARLVIEEQPERFGLRHYHLFDIGNKQGEALTGLKSQHPDKDIAVYPGDFNKQVIKLLGSGAIRQNEPVFCLLDQQTFECKHTTVSALATYKRPVKIELLYFLPIAWLDRALAGLGPQRRAELDWIGNDVTFQQLRKMSSDERRTAFVEWLESLGYKYVTPWPIFSRKGSARIMYYMIHASDHREAPRLMRRAYRNAVRERETYEQLCLDGVL